MEKQKTNKGPVLATAWRAPMEAHVEGATPRCRNTRYKHGHRQSRSYVWWEYVESDSNWADGASREGPYCRWAASHGFEVRYVEVPRIP